MLARLISEVHITSGFQKSFRKLPANVRNLSVRKDRIFRANAFERQLKTHRLKGELDGYWSYSVNFSYRVLFRFIEPDKVIYYDIGTHGIYK
jgi:mRNA-degrading endonuclease YafQ of YafQ-DinJ toxin-antitoxin module